MKRLIATLAFCLASVSVLADGTYSVEGTDIGTLMNDPQARAVLEKYLPETVSNSQFSMAYGMSLQSIKPFDQTGELTDENLEQIDAELKKLEAAAR